MGNQSKKHVGQGGLGLLNQVEVEEQIIRQVFLLPKYKVLLHNDDYHDMFYVVDALVKAVPGLGTQEATQIMLQAHTNGMAIVIVCPKETAEYYQERIQSFGLASTIEPE